MASITDHRSFLQIGVFCLYALASMRDKNSNDILHLRHFATPSCYNSSPTSSNIQHSPHRIHPSLFSSIVLAAAFLTMHVAKCMKQLNNSILQTSTSSTSSHKETFPSTSHKTAVFATSLLNSSFLMQQERYMHMHRMDRSMKDTSDMCLDDDEHEEKSRGGGMQTVTLPRFSTQHWHSA